MEAYVAGVSTRSVDDLVAALGAESGISKSEVSRICAGLDEMVEAFRGRRLDHVEFLAGGLQTLVPRDILYSADDGESGRLVGAGIRLAHRR